MVTFEQKAEERSGMSHDDISGNSIPEKRSSKMYVWEQVSGERMFRAETYKSQREQKRPYSWVNKESFIDNKIEATAGFQSLATHKLF